MNSGKTYFAMATALAVFCTPALAATMRQQHQANQGCVSLVTLKHPDLKGKPFREEVKKCRDNPDSYN